MPKLQDLMVRKVVTARRGTSVRKAAQLMVRRRVGSVVIVHDRTVVGLLTDSDVLRLVASGADPDTTKVEKAMSKPAIVGGPQDDLDTAIRVMVKHRVKRLPVLQERKLVGIVTISQFAHASAQFHQALEKELAKAGRGAKQKFAAYRPPREPPPSFYA